MTNQGPIQDLNKHPDVELLTQNLQATLRKTIFSNSMQFTPRQANQIAQQFGNAFAAFWASRDEQEASEHGRELADEGLGVRSTLSLTMTLRRFCRESSNPLRELPYVADDFCTALLEGYIVGREAIILEVQERTHRAHLAALTQGNEGE